MRKILVTLAFLFSIVVSAQDGPVLDSLQIWNTMPKGGNLLETKTSLDNFSKTLDSLSAQEKSNEFIVRLFYKDCVKCPQKRQDRTYVGVPIEEEKHQKI